MIDLNREDAAFGGTGVVGLPGFAGWDFGDANFADSFGGLCAEGEDEKEDQE